MLEARLIIWFIYILSERIPQALYSLSSSVVHILSRNLVSSFFHVFFCPVVVFQAHFFSQSIHFLHAFASLALYVCTGWNSHLKSNPRLSSKRYMTCLFCSISLYILHSARTTFLRCFRGKLPLTGEYYHERNFLSAYFTRKKTLPIYLSYKIKLFI